MTDSTYRQIDGRYLEIDGRPAPGRRLMAGIKPFRYLGGVSGLLRAIGCEWQQRTGRRARADRARWLARYCLRSARRPEAW